MSSSTTELILIGGYVHNRTGVSLGPYATEMISRLNARRAVLSVAGITEDGYFNSNLLLVETERAMMAAAGEVIIVADSSKFGRQSLANLCPLNAIDKMVVDSGLAPHWRKTVEDSGVELKIADLTVSGEQPESD